MLSLTKTMQVWVGFFVFGLFQHAAFGVILELGPAVDGYATDTQVVNGAIFSVDTGPGGSGTFGPFLKLQKGGNATTAYGHNSDLTPVNSEKSGNELKSLRLSATPINNLNSTDYVGASGDYLEIRFDINRSQSGKSLKQTNFAELQFWVSETPLTAPYNYSGNGMLDPDAYEALNGLGSSGLGTMVWDLDAGGDKNLIIGQSNSGSGAYDGIMFIPLDALLQTVPNISSSYYLTMWARLVDVDSGFDEYAVLNPAGATGVTFLPENTAIPEPGHYALILGVALLVCVPRIRALRK